MKLETLHAGEVSRPDGQNTQIASNPKSLIRGSGRVATAFERFGGACAILAGVTGLLYSVSFTIISRWAPTTGLFFSAFCLLLGGILSSAALAALYSRLLQDPFVEPGFAFWGLILNMVAVAGSAIHGGYDLANVLHPALQTPNLMADLPSPVDPRGLLTFGVGGLGLAALAWLMRRDRSFPKPMAFLGLLLAALFVLIYLGRLIALDPANPFILIPALAVGFLINPLWNIWLGLELRKGRNLE